MGGDGDHPAYCRSGLRIAAGVGAAAALLQLLSGDHSARSASRFQPHKLAAMEAVFHTTRGAPLLIGGLPDEAAGRVRYGLELPRGLSLLVAHDPDALVRGLDELPRADRPPVVLTHLAFQTMVGCGFALVGISLLFLLGRLRRREEGPRLLRLVLLGSPLGLLALEAGWVVTEAGRQPWVIYERLRTADAVTPVGGGTVAFSLAVFTLLYLGLGAALVALLRWLARDAPGAAHA